MRRHSTTTMYTRLPRGFYDEVLRRVEGRIEKKDTGRVGEADLSEKIPNGKKIKYMQNNNVWEYIAKSITPLAPPPIHTKNKL